jgi:hypothetical protein
MQILQAPEARNIVEAYQDGFITVRELREQLEWYWRRMDHKWTKKRHLPRKGQLIP